MKKSIYLDHSATTPVDSKVLKAMLPYFNKQYGNASSLHSFGQTVATAVEKARQQVAQFLNCQPGEIIFTSGTTEANNLAIFGLIKALREQGEKNLNIITSAVEHDAVIEPCRELEKEGIEVTYLPVKSNGVINPEEFRMAIKENTVLVSIMYVNSEVGSIQPISEIGQTIFKINEKARRDWEKLPKDKRTPKPREIYFHTDATQAVNFLNCDIAGNYIHLLSLSGHKIYGPKGVGALYKKTGVPLRPLFYGGGQEKNWRSGTLNVAGIVGLGAAISLLDQATKEKNNKKISKLRDRLVEGILKNVPKAILNTDLASSTPAHAHFTFPGAEGESILVALDLAGIAVSTGSACASNSLEPSHVLLAMGIKSEIAHSSIRITLGKYNTKEEVDRVIKILPPIIARLRKIAPKLY